MSVAATTVTPALFRQVMGGFATGVAVVTTNDGGELHGMTVNSLTAVSLDPVLLLVCLTRGSRSAQAVTSSGRFVVNLLAEDQRELSNGFARRGEDHFAGIEITRTDDGLPVLPGGIGHLVCHIERVDEGGDHLIVLSQVVEAETRPADPLLFYRGRYGHYTPTSRSIRDIGIDWFG